MTCVSILENTARLYSIHLFSPIRILQGIVQSRMYTVRTLREEQKDTQASYVCPTRLRSLPSLLCDNPRRGCLEARQADGSMHAVSTLKRSELLSIPPTTRRLLADVKFRE
jgi:hypothetical protein